MHRFAVLNGNILEAADTRISPFAEGVLYGRGVFTTIAVIGGEPFLWEKHWRRLGDNGLRIGIDVSGLKEAAVRGHFEALIDRNGVKNGRARITVVDESPAGIWWSGHDASAGVFIITGDRRTVASEFSLSVSPYPIISRSPLVGVKSCNYLEPLLALEEAKHRRFDEAIRINESGLIASACMANVFWEKDSRLFTPPLTAGCLAGTTREFVLENIDCTEIEAGVEALDHVDAVYLTSAGIGIVPVSVLNDRKLDTGTPAGKELTALFPTV